MSELNRRHYLLRKTLDELELVPDWQNIQFELVNLVLKDMAVGNEREGKFMNFGYEHQLREVPNSLITDLETVRDFRNDDFFKKPMNPRIREIILEYKESKSFVKIWADYYQPELFESMFFEEI